MNIAPGELLHRIEQGDPPVIVDVRSRAEFDRGHVPGAVHVPFWSVAAHRSDIPATPEELLVVYCGHGPRARFAGAALRRLGFRRILYLNGHWSRWQRAKLPVE